jgi:ATP-dependent protease ClpP protease subunit
MSNDSLIPMFKDQCEVSQSSTTYNAFDIYLDEEIKDPTYYRQAFQVLRSAQQGDLVRIYISSPGGNMNSASIFKNCIENCQADVIAIIEAEAYSAASLIALSCPAIEVKPYATMMCHSAAFGSGGSVQNVRDHVDFVGKHAESIMDDVYRDFLSPKDLEDLKHGREIWLNHVEIGERLDVMFEARQERGCGKEGCTECGVPSDDFEDIEEFDLELLIQEKVDAALVAYDKKMKASAAKSAKASKKIVEKTE